MRAASVQKRLTGRIATQDTDMARILPDDLDAVRATGRFDLELETLDRMRTGFPMTSPSITASIGLAWTTVARRTERSTSWS